MYNRSSTLSLLTPSVNYPPSVRSESALAAAGVNRSGREGGRKENEKEEEEEESYSIPPPPPPPHCAV